MQAEFSIGEVRRITGATLRQLDYWDKAGFATPSGSIARRRSWRTYTFNDLLRISAIVKLRSEGVQSPDNQDGYSGTKGTHKRPIE